MPNRCVVCLAYFNVTSGNESDRKKVHEDEIFGRQDIVTIFRSRIQTLKAFKIATEVMHLHVPLDECVCISIWESRNSKCLIRSVLQGKPFGICYLK